MKNYMQPRPKRKAKPCPPDLFSWASDTEHLTSPAVRALVRRTGYSPALARAIAELAGFSVEGRG